MLMSTLAFVFVGLRPALRGLTFDVEPGHNVGIVGRTGAGKSTIAVVRVETIYSAPSYLTTTTSYLLPPPPPPPVTFHKYSGHASVGGAGKRQHHSGRFRPVHPGVTRCTGPRGVHHPTRSHPVLGHYSVEFG